MLTKTKTSAVGCGLAAILLVAGCSGGDKPAASPTPKATATVAATPTPKASKTPDPNVSPLGGKPATEDEIQYHNMQTKAEELVLSKSYKEAIPILEQAAEQQPKDLKNIFYLLLSHGSLEPVPDKGSAAYPYAQKVIELAPNSSEAERAHAYLAAAEFKLPKDFKYGSNTIASFGAFLYDDGGKYKLTSPAKLHTDLGPRMSRSGKAALWEAEVAPKMVSGYIELPKGTEVTILSENHYFYSLTSWRTPIRDNPTKYDESMFEIDAFYVEVTSDGDTKGKKGWVINQADRYVGDKSTDGFGVWIPNRLGLPRQVQ